jgi:hypothetical protein
MTGRIVFEKKAENNSEHFITGLSAGNYILSIETMNGTINKKLTVISQ